MNASKIELNFEINSIMITNRQCFADVYILSDDGNEHISSGDDDYLIEEER